MIAEAKNSSSLTKLLSKQQHNMSFKSLKYFRRFLFVILTISALLTFFFWSGIIKKEPEKVTVDPWIKKHWNHVKIISDTVNFMQKSKYILLWTKFFGEANFVPNLGCLTQRCNVTSNRNYLNKSSALIFHLRDINLNDMPSFRLKHQVWVLLHHESPHHTPKMLKSLDGIFNWTATYRYDSEIILSPLVKRKKEEIVKDINHLNGKRKMVAWLVSNCNTPGKREDYVKELQKTIPVDIYGACGKLTCLPKMSDECYEKLSKTYRYYLSFENSICKDYVTEKFFRILSTDMIPVVFGGSNYSKVAPPHSCIDALSFKTPKDLGDFLLQTAKDEIRYNSYFEWKKNYRLEYNEHYVCSICEMLIKSKMKHSIYFNIGNWWFQDANCRSWSI